VNFLFTIALFSEFFDVQLFINCHKVNQNPCCCEEHKIIFTTERGITLVENVYFLKFSRVLRHQILPSCNYIHLCSVSPIFMLVETAGSENYLPRCVKVKFIWEIKCCANCTVTFFIWIVLNVSAYSRIIEYITWTFRSLLIPEV